MLGQKDVAVCFYIGNVRIRFGGRDDSGSGTGARVVRECESVFIGSAQNSEPMAGGNPIQFGGRSAYDVPLLGPGRPSGQQERNAYPRQQPGFHLSPPSFSSTARCPSLANRHCPRREEFAAANCAADCIPSETRQTGWTWLVLRPFCRK